MEERNDTKAQKARPAFIRIAPGAKADGLKLINNTAIGDADFLDNQGELNDATFEGNKHIVPSRVADASSGINWTKWGTILGGLTLIVTLGIWLLS